MVRRSPSSTSSHKKSSKRKITLLIKAMFSKKKKGVRRGHHEADKRTLVGSWEHLLSTGSRQSSEEQWSKDTPKGSKWKEIAKVLHETEQTIMERKASWHSKEILKREEEIWTHAEELRTQGSNDDRNKKVRLDGLRRFKNLRDEEEET